MSVAQIVAVVIFIAMFILIVIDKIEKHIVTLGCGLLTLTLVFGFSMRSITAIVDTLNVKNIFTVGFWYAKGAVEESSCGINWATIIFLGGMMVMVEGMAKAGFFRWLCLRLAKLVNYKPLSLFIAFMIMSAVLSMFIDSITVILFLASVTVELAQLIKFSPIPMIISEIFCANLGGAATMCGDPPNIIIGTSLGYSFLDFVRNTGLMVAISLVFVILYFYIVYQKELKKVEITSEKLKNLPNPKDAITNKRDFLIGTFIFALAIVLLVTHAATGLTVAFIGAFIAIITLVSYHKDIKELISKVDYKTLLFFIGLFVVVGGLEKTGVLEIIANLIGKLSGGNHMLIVAIIIWLSAIASAFVDNIPFATTMIPIIKSLAATQGANLDTLAWALSMGTDVGGSATPIGASANVVGIAVTAKKGYLITWGKYCKSAVPATAIAILISMIIIFIRYC